VQFDDTHLVVLVTLFQSAKGKHMAFLKERYQYLEKRMVEMISEHPQYHLLSIRTHHHPLLRKSEIKSRELLFQKTLMLEEVFNEKREIKSRLESFTQLNAINKLKHQEEGRVELDKRKGFVCDERY